MTRVLIRLPQMQELEDHCHVDGRGGMDAEVGRRMAATWQEYQEEVAAFFSSLGCKVEIDSRVRGVRGEHDVDVWVTLSTFGVGVSWLVECKFWKTAVPKEKVLVVAQIAQDVGADRAFVLSESGFQAGAIRMARNANVTLTNLEELRASAKADLLDRKIGILAREAHDLQKRLHDLLILDDHTAGPHPGAKMDFVLDLLGQVFFLKSVAIPHAAADEFPVRFHVDQERAADGDEFVAIASRQIERISDGVCQLETAVANTRQAAQEAVKGLVGAVNDFLEVGDDALFAVRPGDDGFEEKRQITLSAMKRVGTLADEARSLVAGLAAAELHALMRAPIEYPYRDLSEPQVPRARWETSVCTCRSALDALCGAVGLPDTTPETPSQGRHSASQ